MAAEGVATLSLACNVIQVIQYGSETVKLVSQIYKTGSAAKFTELEVHSTQIRSAVAALQVSMQSMTAERRQDHSLDDLYKVSEKCATTVKELEDCIASVPQSGKKRNVFAIIWWLLRNRSNIDRVRRRLDVYQHDLDTRILVNLSLRVDSIFLQAQNSENWKAEWSEIVQDISAKQKKVLETTIRADGNMTRGVIETGTGYVVTQLSDGLSELTKQSSLSQFHYQCERLLASLEYTSMNARRNQIQPPQTDTFDWLFASSRPLADIDQSTSLARWTSLEDWLDNGRDVYWINGKAGSGKSTLMKYIVNSPYTSKALAKWVKPAHVIILSHYFWMAGNEYERNSKGFFLTILHQILVELPELLRQLVLTDSRYTRKKSPDDWSEAELVTTIGELISASQARFCFFVDGLDESAEPFRESQVSVLDFLRAQETNNGTKSCVSSRPLATYEKQFANCPQMRLQDLTQPDMEKVIEDAFQYLIPVNATGEDTSALQEMRREILGKANGVFLWVSLVLKSLIRGSENGDNIYTLQRRLATLPSELEKLYERMWRQLNDDEQIYKEEAAFIFQLVLHREDFWMVNTEEHNSYCRSLCFFAMVINGVDIKSALPENREAAVQRIETQSLSMMQMIRARCAGILEVVGPEETKVPSLANGDLFDSRLKRFITKEVRFIHRSAYAFLVETTFGQSLLTPCPYSRIDIATRIVQCALLFWHTKVTNQGELPYTLHLAERFMVQHANTQEERRELSNAIRTSLEMYETLSAWSSGEQDGSYLLYQYIDPAVRYHTVDTAGWTLSFATNQIFDEAYSRRKVDLNPAFTDYLLLCLASQIHFNVTNPRYHEQEEYIKFLLSKRPRLDALYFLRYPYPFKKSASLILVENLVCDLVDLSHHSEPYELMKVFFQEASHLGWDLSTKFPVLWSVQAMYQNMLMPIERLFVVGPRYGTTAIFEVNLAYLLELILMVCSKNSFRADLTKAVEQLLSASTDVSPQMQVLLISSNSGQLPTEFRNESQRLEDIDKRGWKLPSEQDARRLKEIYEQYQTSRPEVQARGSFGRKTPHHDENSTLLDAVEDCACNGTSQRLFDFLEARGYCKSPDDPAVMHKAPKPFLDKAVRTEEE